MLQVFVEKQKLLEKLGVTVLFVILGVTWEMYMIWYDEYRLLEATAAFCINCGFLQTVLQAFVHWAKIFSSNFNPASI